jgi:hypothetical protein
MPDSPKATLERLTKMLNTWEPLASTKIFGGMTLEQFRTIVDRCIGARDRLADSRLKRPRQPPNAKTQTTPAWARLNLWLTASAPIRRKAKTAP